MIRPLPNPPFGGSLPMFGRTLLLLLAVAVFSAAPNKELLAQVQLLDQVSATFENENGTLTVPSVTVPANTDDAFIFVFMASEQDANIPDFSGSTVDYGTNSVILRSYGGSTGGYGSAYAQIPLGDVVAAQTFPLTIDFAGSPTTTLDAVQVFVFSGVDQVNSLVVPSVFTPAFDFFNIFDTQPIDGTTVGSVADGSAVIHSIVAPYGQGPAVTIESAVPLGTALNNTFAGSLEVMGISSSVYNVTAPDDNVMVSFSASNLEFSGFYSMITVSPASDDPCDDDTTPPAVTCTEFTDTFEDCPQGIFPNSPNGNWLTLAPNGRFNSFVGGSLITNVDVSGCVTDECGGIQYRLASSFQENVTPGSKDIVNVWEFRDGSGNVSPDRVSVRSTIEDTTLPLLVCEETIEIVLPDVVPAEGYEVPQAQINALAVTTEADNCATNPRGPFTVGGSSNRTFFCSQVGSAVPLTLTIDDYNGNSDRCEVMVMVVDPTAPVLVCTEEPVIVELDDDGNLAAGDNTVWDDELQKYLLANDAALISITDDNCGLTYLSGPFTMGGPDARMFDCSDVSPEEPIMRTLVYNNPNLPGPNKMVVSCDYTVIVEDNIDPVPTCPISPTVNNDAGDCGAVVFFDFSSNDNCPGETASAVPGNGSFFAVGTTSVTVTATDASGNTGTCSFSVTVNDTEDPTALCQDVTVQLNASGNGSTTADAVDNGSSDNCGIKSLALDITDFTCDDVGEVDGSADGHGQQRQHEHLRCNGNGRRQGRSGHHANRAHAPDNRPG
jgi:hypothetical protein